MLERSGAHCWSVAVEFDCGALGHLDLTVPVRGDFEEGFQVQGEHGSVKGQLPLPWHHKSGVVECFSVRDRQYHRPLGEDAFTYKLQLEGFADTILGAHPQAGADVEDGIAGLRALVAIARSAAARTPVSLAEVTGKV